MSEISKALGNKRLQHVYIVIAIMQHVVGGHGLPNGELW
jgi:hypothetical protein